MHVLHEAADLQRSSKIPQRHRVGRQACELFDGRCQSEEVVFDGDMEGIRVFEVDGDGEKVADFGEGDERVVAEEVEELQGG